MACALPFRSLLSRRRFLDATGVRHWHWSTACSGRCRDQTPLPGRAVARLITTAIPEQVALILRRTRARLLETPFEVFDQSVLTLNDRFNVRRHWTVIATEIDVGSFLLVVHGHVEKEIRR